MFENESLGLFWRRRSYLERRLILFILILSIVLFTILLCLLLAGKDDRCLTVDCVSASTHVLDYIDHSARPCDDFHQFICGSFIRKSLEYNKTSATKTLEEKTNKQIESIIISDPEQTATPSLKLQRQFYRSCMNTTAIEQDENDTFLTYLDAIGGWPVIKGKFWDEYIFDWKVTMIKARKLGLSFQNLMGLNVDRTKENTTILEITPPDAVEYVSNEIMEPYIEVMRDIAILLHAPSLGISSELRFVVDFQNELHRIISKVRKNLTESQTIEIRFLQDKFPRTSWIQFLNNILSGVAILKETDIVSVASQQYLADLEVLLLKTGKRAQANYMLWRIIQKLIPFLSENIRDRYERFERQFMDRKFQRRSRQEVCIKLSKELFTDVAEIEYVRLYTDQETRSTIKNIFHQVKDKLLMKLKSSTRVTGELNKKVLEEMRNTTIYVGGSDEIFDVDKTESYLGYNDIAFYDDDVVKMVTKVSVNRINHFFGKIGKTDETENLFMFMPHNTVNAFYVNRENLLILSVPLLQDIFYNKNRPNYMNYGALVTTIGHEFAHSLGKLGNKTYIENGRYIFIYNKVFFEIFEESSQCFANQYREFHNKTTNNLEIAAKSNETLEENIADFVGTDIGYDLYQEYIEEHGVEQKLPGVNFTANQVFWIMTGTFLCKNSMEGKEGHFHANSAYRINYRLRNLPQFARDFHCPAGSFMNPEEKCSFF